MSDSRRSADQIDEEAAAWMARVRAGPLTDAMRQSFSDWLAADALHAQRFAHYERLWSSLDRIRDDPRVLTLRDAGAAARGRRIVAIAAAIAVILGAGAAWVGWASFFSGAGQTVAHHTNKFETGVGQVSRIALEDGSSIILDTDSSIEAAFDANRRAINLTRGRAFFRVAHDGRPFSVTSKTLVVTARGTQFVVQVEPAADQVSMLEGSVIATRREDAGRDETVLKAGQSLSAGGDGRWHMGVVDVAGERGWMTGTLTFRSERLDRIAAEMNRYSSRKVVFADDVVAGARLSAVLKAGDMDTFVAGARDLAIARVARQSSSEIVLASP